MRIFSIFFLRSEAKAKYLFLVRSEAKAKNFSKIAKKSENFLSLYKFSKTKEKGHTLLPAVQALLSEALLKRFSIF